MGRAPDYKAAFLATLGANPDFDKPFDANARRWYKEVNDEVTFVNHAIVNPPVDRNKSPEEVRDVYMHVDRPRYDQSGRCQRGQRCRRDGRGRCWP